MMKTTGTFLLSGYLLILGCLLQAAPSATDGFRPLFDGKTLNGWVIENHGDFRVEAGKLVVNRGVGWLRSVETYSDFKLVLEFRFLEVKANSGIFVRTAATCREDETGYPNNGYQIQCMDTVEGNTPLATLINYGGPVSVDHFDLQALTKAYHGQGEWNRMEIICKGEDLSVAINGDQVTHSTGVQNAPGHVGIQAEHGLLEFRSIQIAEL